MRDTFTLSNISPQVGKGFNRDYWYACALLLGIHVLFLRRGAPYFESELLDVFRARFESFARGLAESYSEV